MSERIKDKIKQIREYLGELEKIKPSTFEEYERDITKKAACERYVEKIMEAVVDLAFLIIKDKKLSLPEDDAQAFDILTNAEIIDKDLAEKLRKAKGMRNVIAHLYGEVDDEIIFKAISDQLIKDIEDFLKEVESV